MPPRVKRLPHSDYTIGWICAIAVEREAAVAVLDETHKPPLSVAHNDKNTYTLGNIGRHNVVICSLPPGEYGIQAATRVANHMISTFPRIQATLMVGIAGGAPSETTDIRLGDVVVSTPTESSPAVLQYDRGKTMPSGLLSSGILNKPSEMLSSAAVTLRSRHQGNDSVIPQILSEMQAQHPEKWRPPKAVDELFASTYEHSNGEGTCANCDRNKLVQRPVRSGTVPVIHYGLIGSANQVMKHGRTRDELQKKFGILCFEMEAAGLMNDMPCLVIRGICDYSDSHKNKAWQSFAAATAAAYAKELLGVVPLRHQSDSPLSTLGIDFYSRHERERYERQKGSCGWVLRRPEFVRWKEESHRTCSVLWILGRIGCGKTKVVSRIIEDLESLPDIYLLYFYVDRTEAAMSDPRVILLTLRDQVLCSCPVDEGNKLRAVTEDTPLIDIEWILSSFLGNFPSPVYVVFDGLNELEDDHRTEILRFLASIIEARESRRTGILISSSTLDGCADLGLRPKRVPALEITSQDTFDDIRRYVISRIGGHLHRLTAAERADIADRITDRADGMFLWVALQLPIICMRRTVGDAVEAIEQLSLPKKIQDMYWQAYQQFNYLPPKDKAIVQTIMALLADADFPLHTEVVWEALTVAINENEPTDDSIEKSPPRLAEFTKDSELVIDLCGHLVKIDGDPPSFRFSHSTIYDFFKQARSTQMSGDHHTLLSRLYLSYLSSRRFDHGPFKDVSWAHPGPIEDFMRDYPLLKSASCRWAYHTRQALENSRNSSEITERSLKLCENVDNMRLAFQILLFTQQRMEVPTGLCDSHIISYFGLARLLDVLMRKGGLDVALRDSNQWTPLHWAVRGQHGTPAAATTARLLEYGADINAEDSNGWTPLYHGASCGNLAAVQELLKHNKLKKDFHRNKCGTALIIAAFKGSPEIVKELVEAGADVTVDSKYGTAFQAAALSGNVECFNVLLKARRGMGLSFSTSSLHKYFGDALQLAAFHCHHKMVELLLKQGARVDGISSRLGTPIQAAALGYQDGNHQAAFRKIFDTLLQHGADVNQFGGLLGPALHIAAGRGLRSLAELLIDKGAKVNLATPHGTPLQAASDMKNQEMMDLLQEHGAQATTAPPALPSNIYANISMAASGNETNEIRRFLLWKGIFAVPLKLFKLAVTANNSTHIDLLLSSFKGMMTTAINKQSVAMVEMLAAQGENVFKAVISLASGKDSSQGPHGAINRGFIHRVIKRMAQAAATIFQIAIRGLKRQQAQRFNQRQTPVRMDSAPSDLRDADDDQFKVINKLTLVAVNILGHAIKTKRTQEIVSVLSEAWVSALYGVVSESGLGIPMLERLIRVRAEELQNILARPNASPEENMADAEELAQVGVELLATALSRGPKYKLMAASLARLWILALNDLRRVDAATGGSNVMALVKIFTTEFENGLANDDLQKINRWAEVGVEVLKEAIIDTNRYLVSLLAEEWSTLGQKAIERGTATENLIKKVIAGRVEEFGGYVRDDCVAAAKGLAGTGVAILRAALTHGHEAVERMLTYNIVTVLQMALESRREAMVEEIITQYKADFTAAALDAYQLSQPDQQDTGHLFNTATSLIVMAKERRYTRLLTMLARGSLDVVEAIVSSAYSDFLQDDIARRIRQYHDGSAHTDQTQTLERTFTALSHILEIALMERRSEETFGTLIETCSVLFHGLSSDGKASLHENAVVLLLKDYKGKVEVEELLL